MKIRTDSGMVAIETRYRGATATKGARIIATTASGQRRVISYPHHLPSVTDAAHRLAATQLAESLGWLDDGCELVSGSTPRGYAFVFARRESELCKGCGSKPNQAHIVGCSQATRESKP